MCHRELREKKILDGSRFRCSIGRSSVTGSRRHSFSFTTRIPACCLCLCICACSQHLGTDSSGRHGRLRVVGINGPGLAPPTPRLKYHIHNLGHRSLPASPATPFRQEPPRSAAGGLPSCLSDSANQRPDMFWCKECHFFALHIYPT